MRQTDLFGVAGLEPRQQAVAREKREQTRQLTRVAGSLQHIIVAWCEVRLHQRRPTFHLEELVAGVRSQRQVNAASVDRILRVSRQEGLLNYRVLDRGASLYELLEVSR